MKIAVVAFEDLNDIKIWASIPYFVIKELRSQKIEVELISNLKPVKSNISEIFRRFYYNKVLKRRQGIYRVERNERPLKIQAKIIEKALAKIQPDFILSFFPYQTAYVETKVPIVIWSDATFKLLNKYYPSYKDFHPESYKQALITEKRAMDNASLLFYSSSWAAESSIKDYQNDVAKVKVVPFGSNLDNHENSNIKSVGKDLTTLNLLFIGFDAERKGLNKAIAVTNALNKQGRETLLTVIGPTDLHGYDTKYLNFLGKLNKDIEADFQRIKKAYEDSHFFVLFPSCEAYGIVFCEAASYGLPSITNNLGGVSEIIKDGINGFKFSPDKNPQEIVKLILDYIHDTEKYLLLRKSCLQDYKDRLNWESSIKKFITDLTSIVS